MSGMPRAKKAKVDELPVAAFGYERIDATAVERMATLQLENPETLIGIKRTFEKLKEAGSSDLLIKYSAKPTQTSRMYPHPFVGASTFPGWARRISTYKYYADIDQKSACVNIIVQLARKFHKNAPDLLVRYIDDRNAVVTELGGNVSAVKTAINTVCHAGTHNWRSLGAECAVPALTQLETQVKNLIQQLLVEPQYQKLATMTDEELDSMKSEKWMPKRKNLNPLGRRCAQIWQEQEVRILQAKRDFFESIGRRTGVLLHDGLGVAEPGFAERTSPRTIPDCVLRNCELFVMQKTGFTVQLVEKDNWPTARDWNIFWGPRDPQTLPRRERLFEHLIRFAHSKNLKRYKDSVGHEHATIPGVFVSDYHQSVFAEEALHLYPSRTGVSLADIYEFLSTVNEPRFPLIRESDFNRKIISFTDCYVDLSEIEQDGKVVFPVYHEWVTHVGTPPRTNHFFNMKIMGARAVTECWDSLIDYQLTPAMKENLEILVGRYQYLTGEYDNWQVAINLFGPGDTGKSTTCKAITGMHPNGEVGMIGSSHEKTFGAQGLYTKRGIAWLDAPKDMSKILPQDFMQSLITGEPLPVPIKNKCALTTEPIRAPFLMASNYRPDYRNPGGSMDRRLPTFQFNNKIIARDTTLEQRILHDELPFILLRCVQKYHVARAAIGTAGFWESIACQELHKNRQLLRSSSDLLSDFLANGDARVNVVKAELDKFTTLMELTSAFNAFLQETCNLPKRGPIKDYHPIEAAGYTVNSLSVCKVCRPERVASAQACGNHYFSGENRRTLVVFNGMQIIPAPAVGFNLN